MPPDDPAAPSPARPDGIEFPPLHEATLAPDELRRLFADIERHGQQVQIMVKGSARGRASGDAVTLARARSIIEEQAARGVQIRYRYDGADWWDTLIPGADGVRLVRVRHDFPDPPSSLTSEEDDSCAG